MVAGSGGLGRLVCSTLNGCRPFLNPCSGGRRNGPPTVPSDQPHGPLRGSHNQWHRTLRPRDAGSGGGRPGRHRVPARGLQIGEASAPRFTTSGGAGGSRTRGCSRAQRSHRMGPLQALRATTGGTAWLHGVPLHQCRSSRWEPTCLLDIVAHTGLTSSVRMTGYPEDRQVSALLFAADLVLVPFAHSLSATSGEPAASARQRSPALAHGRAIVGTAPPVADAALVVGNHPIYVPARDQTAPGDAVAWLLHRPQLRHELGRARRPRRNSCPGLLSPSQRSEMLPSTGGWADARRVGAAGGGTPPASPRAHHS
jgi:hypothetical protein